MAVDLISFPQKGGCIAQKVSILATRPNYPRFNSQHFQNNFSEEKTVDVADVNERHCSKESGQGLENVDLTHLVLASGKLSTMLRDF